MDEEKTMSEGMAKWERARLLYVTTDATCVQVAEQLGLGRRAVQKRCWTGCWAAQRKLFRETIYDRALEETREAGVASMENLMAAAMALTASLRKVAEDENGFKRYLVSEKQGGPKREEIFEKTDMEALRAASGALKQLTDAARDLWGIPDVREGENLRLAAERLELMRQRGSVPEQEPITVEFAVDEALLQ